MKLARLVTLALPAVLVPMLGVVAWAAGGGAESRPEPPRAGAIAASKDAGGSTNGSNPSTAPGRGEAYVAHTRLLEKMQDARIDAKNLAASKAALNAHWRKMRVPWYPIPATDAGKQVTSIALRTSTTETQWSMPTSAGGAWKPEARVWNMNEGSFDQREALALPAPSTVLFKVEIPKDAVLAFTPGSVNATGDALDFSVFVVDGRGERKKIGGARLAPGDTRKWGEETRIDLAAYAGQTVDLEIGCDASPKNASEGGIAKGAAPPRRDADAGGGGMSDETPVTPGATLVGLVANPTVMTKQTPKVPYNVLFVVVDALRPDVIASFHDDADDEKKAQSKHPPLEAALPKVPGLMPVLDDLAKKSVVFQHAYSGGAWTRPGTLAMLSGERSTELGIATTPWVLSDGEVSRFYASKPPMLPILMRDTGVLTRAFVNNYFMVGYAPVGVDMGFERVDDHRYRTKDTDEITKDTLHFLDQNRDTRFFAFVNYNSPHEPWEPPAEMQKRVPAAPDGPSDRITRLYMAEAGKDDAAIGKLLAKLEELKIDDHTIVVVTADHGETLSAAHTGSGLDKMQIRYHHAASNFEETTRIPILVYAPGLLAPAVVKERVRNTDIAPTLLDLEGLDPSPKMSGKSLVGLAKGQKEADPRVVVSEGRASKAILWDHYRLLLRDVAQIKDHDAKDKGEDLFDLDADPGERVNLAPRMHDVVMEMRARLDAAQKNVPVAGSHEAKGEVEKSPKDDAGAVHLRFAGGGAPHRISGKISSKATLGVVPVGCDGSAIKATEHEIEIALTTAQASAVGVDLAVTPPGTPLTWQFYVDDQPLAETRVFAGPYGIVAKDMALGITTEDARQRAIAEDLPLIDPRRDFGLFLTRERRGEKAGFGREELTGEGADEMNRLLREWGYAK